MKEIEIYKHAELMVNASPEHKELMLATLIAYETGIIEGYQHAITLNKKGYALGGDILLALIQASEKRTQLIRNGNLRPDLEVENPIDAL